MGDHNSLVLNFVSSTLHRLLADLAAANSLPMKSLRKDQCVVQKRLTSEGLAFATKTLPSLGRSLDSALATDACFSAPDLGFKLRSGVPLFLGDYFGKIFSEGGYLLEDPSPAAVRAVRQICYLFYKLEQPFDEEVVKSKLDDFVRVDMSLPEVDSSQELTPATQCAVDRARTLIWRLFCDRSLAPKGTRFDPADIVPRHGPGAVATGEKPERKFRFSRFYRELDKEYPYSEYFFYNYSHLCDRLIPFLSFRELDYGQAKVVLVPKDSRGPRLISMEPLEYQWIQQGLGRAMVGWIEAHPWTKGLVNFTDQNINRDLAQYASRNALSFDTLDMKDASDRVSHWLVSSLFPDNLLRKMEACRTKETLLPDGRVVTLRKFAPMGSALCFPVESLVFWALATAILNPHVYMDGCESFPCTVHVYGDDLIVPHGTLEQLEPVFTELHLRFNENKCCHGSFFRESCGMDAFRGECVSPVRIKQIGSTPNALTAMCAYAKAFSTQGSHSTAEFLYSWVERDLGPLPYSDGRLSISRYTDDEEKAAVANLKFPFRLNADTQTWEMQTTQPRPAKLKAGWSGWEELFRYVVETGATHKFGIVPSVFAEGDPGWVSSPHHFLQLSSDDGIFAVFSEKPAVSFQQCVYTVQRVLKLRKVWTSWR